MDEMRVAVQQRRRLVREGLAISLNAAAGVQLLGAVSDDVALRALCEAAAPDVVVLELDCDAWDPCQLAVRIREHHSAARIIGMRHDDEPMLTQEARRAGIVDAVPSAAGVRGLLEAIHAGQSRRRPFARSCVTVDLREAKTSLTEREREILTLIGAGDTTTTIAERLAIRPKTVESHKQRLFSKLGVQNQAHAVAVAMRAGFVGVNVGAVPRR